MKVYIHILILSITFNVYSVILPDFKKIKTQTQLAKKYLPSYILNIKERVIGTLDILNIHVNDYRFIEHESERLYGDQFYIFDNYFAGNMHKMIPSVDHSLTFANDGSINDVIKSDFGFCAGFTTVTRKLNLGAHFDPNFILTNERDIPTRDLREEWIQYFSKKLSNILENSSFQLIPYYKNLRDMMSDQEFPEFIILIKKYIAVYWSYHNINTSGVKAVLSTQNKAPIKQLYKFYNNLVNRLNSGINPIYYLAKPSDDLFIKGHWIHVLQAYDVTEMQNDGSFTILFWDVNSNHLEGMKKKVPIKIIKDHKGRSKIQATFGESPIDFNELKDEGWNGEKKAYHNGFALSGLFEIGKDKDDITSFINNEDNYAFCDQNRIQGQSICFDSIDHYQN